MSGPWWGRERGIDTRPRFSGETPQLVPPGRGDVVRALLARAGAYVPEWSNRRDGDAGYALARLFSEMAEPLLTRLNRLPEKSLVEFLRASGIAAMPELPARVLLTFAADDAAPAPVLVPEGARASTEPADGSDGPVIFETERSLYVAPLTLAAAFRKTGGLFEEIDLASAAAEGGVPWRPFGTRPQPGATLMIGLSGKIAARPNLSLAVALAGDGDAPPPVQGGGGAGVGRPIPLLKWDVLDGTRYEPAAIVRDETRGFTQSGIVELRMPARWRPGAPEGVDLDTPMFWLRVRLAYGDYAEPPVMTALQLNAVMATAVETVRDEVLDFVAGSNRQQVRLARAPMVAGSLQLVVIEPGLDGDAEIEWQPTDSLSGHGATDRVYVPDAATGVLTFGDNVRGMRLPLGFRNVIARKYQVGGGVRGRIAAAAAFTMVQSIPFLKSVTNPMAASGGRDTEPRARTMRRGPQEIRTAGRAVTPADYELLALQAPGADVERAFAQAGRDARFPGARVPGSVTLHLVSSDRGADPPVPDAGTLEAVSNWLAQTVAPAGIQLVAAATQFQWIGARATIVIRPGAEVAAVVEGTLAALQDFLHPLRGGAAGEGWPFGGTVRYQALTRVILDRVPGALAVSGLDLVVDGVSRGKCRDWAVPEGMLVWPHGHEVIPVEAGERA